MKNCLLLFSTLIHISLNAQLNSKPVFINPTGSYKLDWSKIDSDGETYGKTGEIAIKLLNKTKILIDLNVCRGAPGFHTGELLDTLNYDDNKAVYTSPEEDSTCKITFTFKKNSVTVSQYQKDSNSGCGFGQGVFADGYYKKTSSKVPIIDEDR